MKMVGDHGPSLYRCATDKGKPGLTSEAGFIRANMLSNDRNRSLEFGRDSDLVIPGHHVAAKTGTTNDFRDNLTIGFTPNLAVAVWVGNADHTPMRSVSGIVGAAPIFHGFITQVLNRQPDRRHAVPDGLQPVTMNGYTAYLLPGTEQVAQ